jgi:predicted membrane-bound mannosyltransferase
MSQQPKRDRRRQDGANGPGKPGGASPGAAEAAVGSVTLPRPETAPPPTRPARPAKPQPGGTRPGARRDRADRRTPKPAGVRPDSATAPAPSDEIAGVRQPRRRRLTWEGVAYLVLLAAAALTRFWDLGGRALHHDESLHAYYSWLFATGGDYTHDPLMHGPFLFHANALVYLLFGDSDASSRYMPALFGTVLVGLPYLLRGSRFLGRYGALAASCLFLISPGFLYYSRYIRHDLYTVVGSLLLFTCLARFVERPERRWLIGAGASLAFLLTNHEIVFAIAAVFAAYLWGALLWGRLRPLLPLQIGALAFAGALVLALPAIESVGPLPLIPWDKQGVDSAPSTRDNQVDYYLDLLTHPLIVALLLLAAAFVAGCWWVLRDERRRRGAGLLDDVPDGTVEAAVVAVRRDPPVLWATLAVGGVIFVALFTTLFTNVYGLASGTISTDGTLLYWLGQQDVRRGDQPWFFFLTLAPQYELFLVTFGVAGAVVTLWRACLSLRDPERRDPSLLFRLWLVAWFGAIFAGLSYAGEKMPWLIVHIALPGLLLAGALIGDLVEAAIAAWQRTRHPSPLAPHSSRLAPRSSRLDSAWLGPGLAIALLALAGGWWLMAADLTYGEFVQPASGGWSRVVTEESLDRWWLLALPPLAAGALVVVAGLARGAAFAGRWATVALVAGLALLQVHQAWRLSYLEGDIPRDSLIYNTTSPDVTRMMGEIGELSAELTGGKDLVIWYDDDTAWPMQWYLRDYPRRRYYGPSLDGPPPNDAAIVLVSTGNLPSVQPYLDGYTPTEYVMRWHEPEAAIYRNFAIAPELDPGLSAWKNPEDPHGVGAILGSIGDSVATQFEPAGEQRLFRIVFYREMPTTFTEFNYVVFVRDDLLPLYNSIRY